MVDVVVEADDIARKLVRMADVGVVGMWVLELAFGRLVESGPALVLAAELESLILQEPLFLLLLIFFPDHFCKQ